MLLDHQDANRLVANAHKLCEAVVVVTDFLTQSLDFDRELKIAYRAWPVREPQLLRLAVGVNIDRALDERRLDLISL